jgi:hypothetical protein
VWVIELMVFLFKNRAFSSMPSVEEVVAEMQLRAKTKAENRKAARKTARAASSSSSFSPSSSSFSASASSSSSSSSSGTSDDESESDAEESSEEDEEGAVLSDREVEGLLDAIASSRSLDDFEADDAFESFINDLEMFDSSAELEEFEMSEPRCFVPSRLWSAGDWVSSPLCALGLGIGDRQHSKEAGA